MSTRRLAQLLAALIVAIITATGASTQFAPDTSTSTTAPHTTSAGTYYPVVHVVDGDTITIRKDNADLKLRLIGLDTPEVVDPRRPVQCFGRAASDEAHRMLDGASVRIELDPSQGEFDKYKRTLAYVFLANPNAEGSEINFNQYMIEQGFGHEYTYRLPYKYQTEFKAAEKTAREAGRGLWAPGVCEN